MAAASVRTELQIRTDLYRDSLSSLRKIHAKAHRLLAITSVKDLTFEILIQHWDEVVRGIGNAGFCLNDVFNEITVLHSNESFEELNSRFEGYKVLYLPAVKNLSAIGCVLKIRAEDAALNVIKTPEFERAKKDFENALKRLSNLIHEIEGSLQATFRRHLSSKFLMENQEKLTIALDSVVTEYNKFFLISEGFDRKIVLVLDERMKKIAGKVEFGKTVTSELIDRLESYLEDSLRKEVFECEDLIDYLNDSLRQLDGAVSAKEEILKMKFLRDLSVEELQRYRSELLSMLIRLNIASRYKRAIDLFKPIYERVSNEAFNKKMSDMVDVFIKTDNTFRAFIKKIDDYCKVLSLR